MQNVNYVSGASRNLLQGMSTTYLYTEEWSSNPNSYTLKPNRLQQDRRLAPFFLSGSILPPPSAPCAFKPARKNKARFSKC